MTVDRVAIHGHTVAFHTAGTGPVVLLVHGMARSAATWRHVVPVLAGRFTVVAPDLLGHGASAKPYGEYSLGAHANLLRDLLATLGHDRATVVGHSLGGGIAMQLAYQYPERCERLVLVSSGGLGREVSTLLRALSVPGAEHVLSLLCAPTVRDAGSRVAGWLARVGIRATPAVEECWGAFASLASPDARRAFFRTLRAVIDAGGQAVSATDRLYLASLLPTLVVWGAADTLIPVSHAHAAHAAIPGSRLAIFDDAGHFPHCDDPERFARTLVEFCDTSEPVTLTEPRWRDLLRGSAGPTSTTPADQHAGGPA